MDYYLYKLKFDGAVHFGQSESALSLYTTADHFRADTLFSHFAIRHFRCGEKTACRRL